MIPRRRKSAEDLSAGKFLSFKKRSFKKNLISVRPKQKSHEDSDQDLDYIPRIKKEKTSPGLDNILGFNFY